MGILARPAEIVRSLPLARGFSVCELGNQFYRADGGKRPADVWYDSIGVGRYVSIDANGAATHCADLNKPLGIPSLAALGTFDLVTDFGTGEHIFNQAQVFETLHDLAKIGGFIVIDRPKQGWAEHCFYNIHETLIRDIAAANAYDVVHMETHGVEGHGELLLAVMRRLSDAPFRYPNQGKYKAMLAAADSAAAYSGGITKIDSAYDEHLGAALRPMPNRIKRGDVLIELIRKYGWTRGAEIGVYNGEAVFFKLLDACPDLHMIAVDQWSATDKDYGDLTAVGEAFRERARDFVVRAFVIHGPSTDVETLSWVDDGELDFVFIDADHSYEAVKADIAAWTPKVRKGGWVLGHDWNEKRFPGVVRAVTEAFGDVRVQLSADHVWGAPV